METLQVTQFARVAIVSVNYDGSETLFSVITSIGNYHLIAVTLLIPFV